MTNPVQVPDPRPEVQGMYRSMSRMEEQQAALGGADSVPAPAFVPDRMDRMEATLMDHIQQLQDQIAVLEKRVEELEQRLA